MAAYDAPRGRAEHVMDMLLSRGGRGLMAAKTVCIPDTLTALTDIGVGYWQGNAVRDS